ncbi:prepilin-type N-terminal cleavage/methylation domain-containing protein [Phragmitibacter flavus]|uniref:Prepilin-type N-terminal cleavage/methylation domain-containing protein n=1 Tax=Phragmitibacter flavus TaxID=2576071 RepID=A0A5R8K9B3_9BACT|nr:prepilin-type N-terminal cleavage/methylation domain-containing protein [Phragmitibacter flavus]TLD68887.1 prepilin-type N-terminal cleavage/methylation domain-containing protein [Phragmitibacter flavus]
MLSPLHIAPIRAAPYRDSRFSPAAFTLIELLVVITIIGALLALSGAGLSGAMGGMAITNAGNKVSQLCDGARQRAMTGNVLTAVVIVTNAGTNEDGRAMAVFEYPPGGPAWKQFTEWNILPDGITVDVNNNSYGSFVHNSTPLPFFAPGSVKYHDNPLTANQFAARVFVPSGGLLESNAASQMQVVDGTTSSNTTTYTKVLNGKPVNFYRITILGATGKTKIERPELP